AVAGLVAGTYNYSVEDANGCTAAASVTISEPELLVITATAGTILCNGGTTTVSVSATGGTQPYVPGVIGSYTVGAGTYSYTITDANGCTATTSVTISEPEELEVTANAGIISCNGETTTVNISATGGTPPYSGTGVFTVPAGAFSFTVSDANECSQTVNGLISQPSEITATISAGTIQVYGGTTT